MKKILIGLTCCSLFASAFCPSVLAQSKKVKKGEQLEQQSQQLENKAQQQEAEGHPLRAGRDAKKAARKAARADKKLQGTGLEPGQPGGAGPSQ
jgi:outer membrane murein-binding lipoprotein Lpp